MLENFGKILVRKRLLKVYLYKWLFLLFLLILLICGMYRFRGKPRASRNLIIQAVFYFDQSKFYADDTMVILAIGEERLLDSPEWLGCVSIDKNRSYHLDASPLRPQYYQTEPTEACSFVNLIISCRTVPNPESFYIIDSTANDGQLIELEFTSPVREKHRVVSCTSPIYFGERWHLYAASIEYYSHFGVDKQVYYVMSALESVYQLLLEYEKDGLVDVHHWTVPDIRALNSTQKVWNRDQIGSLNHCFMKYRESAEFVIIHDPDELLWIAAGDSFFDYFDRAWTPETAFLNFHSFNSEISAAKTVQKFDLFESLSSIKVSTEEHPGKSVYRPENVETIWVHWALIFDPAQERTWPAVEQAKFLHVRDWHFLDDLKNNASSSGSPFDARHLHKMSESYRTRVEEYTSFNPLLASLDFTNHYYSAFDACMTPSFDKCLTLTNCTIQPISGVSCYFYQTFYRKIKLTAKDNIYVQKHDELTHSPNGCQ